MQVITTMFDFSQLPTEAQKIFQELVTENDALKAKVKQLSRLALQDELTGLLNRRGFERSLMPAVSYSQRYKIPVCLLFVDLDNFKAINDSYGHQIGDNVLKTVGHRLVRQLRESDVVCRLGGDEFVALLWHVEEEAARSRAGAIMDGVCRDGVRVNGDLTLQIRASAGVTVLERTDTPERFLARADQAMYRAKHNLRRAS